MPTPVNTAKQCLTQEAASALDEAVSVAKRRGHHQTTSLHMVSSLLSLPNSSLREACMHARANSSFNSNYSSRVQFKALELSLSVSLDRLPSSSSLSNNKASANSAAEDELLPPVSNSLMAAVKRSQASQRRQPENFSFYNQQQQQLQEKFYYNNTNTTSSSSSTTSLSSSSSNPVVKVELKNLILAILDDPLVSRVFGEAGFRSYDVKMALIRPPMAGNFFGSGRSAHMFGSSYSSTFSRYYRGSSTSSTSNNNNNSPPLFLCNFAGDIAGSVTKGFNFPFMMGCFTSAGDGDEQNLKRICEVMFGELEKKRNPLLLGVGASDVLMSFLEILMKKIDDGDDVSTKGSYVLPQGLSIISLKNDILKFVMSGDSADDEGMLKSKLDEVVEEKIVGKSKGVVLNLGDLEALDGVGVDKLGFLVSGFSKLLEVHRGKLWLIGAVGSYEGYFKILNKVSNMEEDWDLEILPITSLRFSMGGGSYPRSSLMESFVPLGGFFSMPSEIKSPLISNKAQYASAGRGHLCNEKYEQELALLTKAELSSSVSEEYRSTLLSWLRNVESSPPHSSTSSKGKDDDNDNRLLLNAKIMGLQKKWDYVCRQNHHNETLSKMYAPRFSHQFPHVTGFRLDKEGDENTSKDEISHSSKASFNKVEDKNVDSSLSTGIERRSSVKGLSSLVLLSKSGSLNTPQSDSKEKKYDLNSPASVTSTNKYLGFGIGSDRNTQEIEKQDQPCENIVHALNKSSPSCFFDNPIYAYVKDPKLFYKALIDRVGDHHQEAVSAFLRAITKSQTKVSRSHLCLYFKGPDRFVKTKLGLALAEISHGSTESFIYVDLSFKDKISHRDTLFKTLELKNTYEVTMRGTFIDYLVEKLNKKPCVVFLESIDKADLAVQNCLSRAMKTGRLVDFNGREANIGNSIFLGSSSSRCIGACSNKRLSTRLEDQSNKKYSEKDVLKLKGNFIRIVIGYDLNDDPMSDRSDQSYAKEKGFFELNQINKRKLAGSNRTLDQTSFEVAKRANKSSNSYLDLNLPAEDENDVFNTSSVKSDSSDSSSGNSRSWLEDFERETDLLVLFEPFDFDSIAEKLYQETHEILNDIAGSKCSMEIERKVMLQIIAALYVYGNKKVEDWIQNVLRQGFVEALRRFSLDSHSIVKLVACEKILGQEQHEKILPARIIMN